MSKPEDSNFRRKYLGEWAHIQPCPECRAGKHTNCVGWALDENDQETACPCAELKHPELTLDDLVVAMGWMDGQDD